MSYGINLISKEKYYRPKSNENVIINKFCPLSQGGHINILSRIASPPFLGSKFFRILLFQAWKFSSYFTRSCQISAIYLGLEDLHLCIFIFGYFMGFNFEDFFVILSLGFEFKRAIFILVVKIVLGGASLSKKLRVSSLGLLVWGLK